MKFKDSFDRGQLIALCTVIVLVPALRLFPSVATQFAGRAAWLSAPAALFPVLLYILFLDDLMERRMEGEGLAELLMRALGPVAGKIALGFSALWFLLCIPLCGLCPLLERHLALLDKRGAGGL